MLFEVCSVASMAQTSVVRVTELCVRVRTQGSVLKMCVSRVNPSSCPSAQGTTSTRLINMNQHLLL